MRFGRCPRKTRVNTYELCPLFNCFCYPLKRDRMVFRGIASDDHNSVGVAYINPVICHCTPPECLGQTGHSGGVSYAGLVLDVNHSQSPHKLAVKVALLVIKSSASKSGYAFDTIDFLTAG